MLLKRTKVLPDNVHYWRGKRWAHLAKKEAKEGDALRIIAGLKRAIAAANKLSLEGKLTQQSLQSQANKIIILSSEMADEILKRERETGIPEENWNAAYVNCLRHHWKQIPKPLRKTIIRLSAGKSKT